MVNEGVYVLGAGGHAKVVISTLCSCGIAIAGVLDDSPDKWGQHLMGYLIKGPIGAYAGTIRRAIIAIGDNKTRARVAQLLNTVDWVTVIHASAYIDSTAQIGKGTVVFAGAVIQPDCVVGEHSIINTSSSVDHDCFVGSYVHIAPGARLAGGVRVGRGTLVGMGAVVLPEVEIGEWCIIGAGAVVTRNIPSFSVAVGVPARIIRSIAHDENPDGISRD